MSYMFSKHNEQMSKWTKVKQVHTKWTTVKILETIWNVMLLCVLDNLSFARTLNVRSLIIKDYCRIKIM